MGAGKSTVGREAARRLGRPFVDLDDEVERREGRPAGELLDADEAAFRQAEARAAADVLDRREPSVVALGGGAVVDPATREALARRAVTVHVDVDPGDAWERARGTGRPLARDEASFRALWAERRPVYDAVAAARAADAHDVALAAAAVHVEPGAHGLLETLVPPAAAVSLAADARVAGIHGPAVQVALSSRLASTHELPPGEAAKTAAVWARLLDELPLGRDGCLVALGGGSTTDVAGFAAATHLRGIPWVAVPTSLVGQVDAAIGGKTGIDTAIGKNRAGAFHWPARTVVDPLLLATLPAAERANGMAEAVKTGLLAGEPLWELPDAELVRRCAAHKAAVCLRDPHEAGPREALNLGHTFAHALEAASGYALPHGRAVALGLLAALRLSGADTSVVEEVLRPEPALVDREAAWDALRRDKKARGGRIRLVLLPRPGEPELGAELPDADVRLALDALIAD